MTDLRDRIVDIIENVTFSDIADETADAIIDVIRDSVNPLTIKKYSDGGRAEGDDGRFHYEWYETRSGLFNVLNTADGTRIGTEVSDPTKVLQEDHINAVLSYLGITQC